MTPDSLVNQDGIVKVLVAKHINVPTSGIIKDIILQITAASNNKSMDIIEELYSHGIKLTSQDEVGVTV